MMSTIGDGLYRTGLAARWAYRLFYFSSRSEECAFSAPSRTLRRGRRTKGLPDEMNEVRRRLITISLSILRIALYWSSVCENT